MTDTAGWSAGLPVADTHHLLTRIAHDLDVRADRLYLALIAVEAELGPEALDPEAKQRGAAWSDRLRAHAVRLRADAAVLRASAGVTP